MWPRECVVFMRHVSTHLFCDLSAKIIFLEISRCRGTKAVLLLMTKWYFEIYTYHPSLDPIKECDGKKGIKSLNNVTFKR